MSDTSAAFVAADVADACRIVIDDIEVQRRDTLRNIIVSKIGTLKYPDMSYGQIAEALGPEERMIPENLRVSDYHRCWEIAVMAEMIKEDGADLKINVSLADFQILRRALRNVRDHRRAAEEREGMVTRCI